jgi:hypothetical protein
MLPLTHAWSRAQKRLIIGIVIIAIASFGALVCAFEHYYRPPDESLLVGTWEMTTPPTASNYTLLRLDEEPRAHWHTGAWVRRHMTDRDGRAAPQGYSEMMWYAGGSYIYMRFNEGWPQIWQIIDILPDELTLRHAKQDYHFKRTPD